MLDALRQAERRDMAGTSQSENLRFRPLPEDEYDSYLQQILALVEGGASREEVLAYMDTVEREYLMLTAPAGDKSKFVSAVFELR